MKGEGRLQVMCPRVRRLDSTRCELYHASMAASFDILAQDALGLPPDQRIALARRLLSSVESDLDPDADAAWEREIDRRIAEADAGDVTPIPAAEVFARLRRIAPDRP